MNDKSDRTFRPQLETFEERALLSTFFPGVRQLNSLAMLGASSRFTFNRPNFTFSHPTTANGSSSGSLFSGSSPATNVHILVSPSGGSQFSYSVVPTQQFFGLTNMPSRVTLSPTFDPGWTTTGLFTPATLQGDPGIHILV